MAEFCSFHEFHRMSKVELIQSAESFYGKKMQHLMEDFEKKSMQMEEQVQQALKEQEKMGREISDNRKLKVQNETLQDMLKQKTLELESVQSKVAEYFKKMQDMKETSEKLVTNMKKSNEEVEDLKRNVLSLTSRNSNVIQEKGVLRSALEENKAVCRAISQELLELKEEHKKCRGRIDHLTKALEDVPTERLEERMNLLKKNAELQEKYSQVTGERSGLLVENEDLRKKVFKLESEIEDLRREHGGLTLNYEARIQDLKSENDALKNMIVELEEGNKVLDEQVNLWEEKVKGLEADSEAEKENYSQLLKESEVKLKAVQEKLTEVERTVDGLGLTIEEKEKEIYLLKSRNHERGNSSEAMVGSNVPKSEENPEEKFATLYEDLRLENLKQEEMLREKDRELKEAKEKCLYLETEKAPSDQSIQVLTKMLKEDEAKIALLQETLEEKNSLMGALKFMNSALAKKADGYSNAIYKLSAKYVQGQFDVNPVPFVEAVQQFSPETYESQITALEVQVEKLTQQLKAYKQKNFEDIDHAVELKAMEKVREIRMKYSLLEREYKRLLEKLEGFEGEEGRVGSKSSERIQELTEEVEKFRAGFDQTQEELKQVRADLNSKVVLFEEETSALRLEISLLKDKNDTSVKIGKFHKFKCEELTNQLNLKKAEASKLVSENRELTTRVEVTEGQLMVASDRLAFAEGNLKRLEDEVRKLEVERRELRKSGEESILEKLKLLGQVEELMNVSQRVKEAEENREAHYMEQKEILEKEISQLQSLVKEREAELKSEKVNCQTLTLSSQSHLESLSAHLRETEEALREAQREAAEAQEKVQLLEVKQSTLENSLARAEEELTFLKSRGAEKKRREVLEEAQRKALEAQLGEERAREELSLAQSHLVEYKKIVATTEEALLKAEEKSSYLGEKLGEVTRNLASSEVNWGQEKTQFTTQLEELTREKVAVDNELVLSKESEANLRCKLKESTEKCTELSENVENLQKILKDSEEIHQREVTAHQETQSKLKLNLEKVNELELSLEETKRTVQVVQSQLAEEKTNNEALQKDILEKEGKIRELKTQGNILFSRLEAHQSLSSQNLPTLNFNLKFNSGPDSAPLTQTGPEEWENLVFSLRKENEALENEKFALNRENKGLCSKVRETERELEGLRAQLQAEIQRASVAFLSPTSLPTQVAELERVRAAMEAVEEEKRRTFKDLNDCREMYGKLEAELEPMRREKQNLEIQLESSQQKVQLVESQRDMWKKRVEKLLRRDNRVDLEAHQKVQQELKEAQSKLTTLENALKAVEKNSTEEKERLNRVGLNFKNKLENVLKEKREALEEADKAKRQLQLLHSRNSTAGGTVGTTASGNPGAQPTHKVYQQLEHFKNAYHGAMRALKEQEQRASENVTGSSQVKPTEGEKPLPKSQQASQGVATEHLEKDQEEEAQKKKASVEQEKTTELGGKVEQPQVKATDSGITAVAEADQQIEQNVVQEKTGQAQEEVDNQNKKSRVDQENPTEPQEKNKNSPEIIEEVKSAEEGGKATEEPPIQESGRASQVDSTEGPDATLKKMRAMLLLQLKGGRGRRGRGGRTLVSGGVQVEAAERGEASPPVSALTPENPEGEVQEETAEGMEIDELQVEATGEESIQVGGRKRTSGDLNREEGEGRQEKALKSEISEVEFESEIVEIQGEIGESGGANRGRGGRSILGGRGSARTVRRGRGVIRKGNGGPNDA